MRRYALTLRRGIGVGHTAEGEGQGQRVTSHLRSPHKAALAAILPAPLLARKSAPRVGGVVGPCRWNLEDPGCCAPLEPKYLTGNVRVSVRVSDPIEACKLLREREDEVRKLIAEAIER